MRKRIIAGNWKMYKNPTDSMILVNSIKRELADVDEVDVVICPPFTSLSYVKDILLETKIQLGAQDVHWEKAGTVMGPLDTRERPLCAVITPRARHVMM